MRALRTFIAVPVPAAVSRRLEECSRTLAGRWPPGAVRWVSPENVHLTLRFLGDTDPDQVAGLAAALRQVASAHRGFVVALDGVGCFPNARRPRVIWAGLSDPELRLDRLQRDVERAVRACGWPREGRAFAPHLTLGRVREGAPAPAGEWLPSIEPAPLPVRELRLVESQLAPAGAIYRTLAAASLAEADAPGPAGAASSAAGDPGPPAP